MFLLIVAQMAPSRCCWPASASGRGHHLGHLPAGLVLLAGTMDNFPAPFLIKRGADPPADPPFWWGHPGGCLAMGSSVSSSAPWCWRWATPCWIPGSKEDDNQRRPRWARRRDDSFIPMQRAAPRAALFVITIPYWFDWQKRNRTDRIPAVRCVHESGGICLAGKYKDGCYRRIDLH